MAAINPISGKLSKKRGGLRRPKRRIGIRNDLTPMVDIAFLLLIFYMVTTVFSSPYSMEIALPSGNDPILYPESKLLRIFVDKDDALYFQTGQMYQPEMTDIQRLKEIIDEKNRNVNELAMVLKMDGKSSYDIMIRIVDIIQSVERDINADFDILRETNPGVDSFSVRFSLDNLNAWDEYVLNTVRQGGTVTGWENER